MTRLRSRLLRRHVPLRTAVITLLSGCVLAVPVRAQGDSVQSDTLRRAVLPPLRVSVTRAERAMRDVPYAVSVVRGEEARARPALDLDELLRAVPGVFAVNRQNPSQDIRLSIRGFGARSPFGVRGVRVLLDGIPQTLPDGQGQLTNIDPADVARIEVLRGTASTQYGNAAGGVVAVTSRVGAPDEDRLAVRINGGAFGSLRTHARATASWGGGGVSATAGYTRADGYREHAARRRVSGGVSLRHRVGSATLTTHVRAARDPLAQNPGSLTAAQFDSLPTMANPRNLAADARKVVTQALAGAQLRGVAGGVAYELAAFGLRRSLDNPLAFATIVLDRWAWGTRAAATLAVPRIPAQPELTVGIDAQWQRDDRANLDPDDGLTTLAQLERVREVGPYAQVTLQPHRLVRLTGGVRYDRISFAATDRFVSDGDQSGTRVMGAVSGSAGIAVRAAPWLTAHASASTGFESPTTTELVNRPSGGGGFNPDLGPQRATTVEAGVRGRADRVAFEASYFDTRVRGGLVPFEVADGSGRQFFRNAGSGWHRGVETSVRATTPRGGAVVATYTFADYRFRQFRVDGEVYDGNRLPGIPRHRVFGSVQHAAGPAWMALDVTWTSAVFADDANQAPVDGWVVVDVRAAVRAEAAGVRVEPFAMIANVFGRRYVGSVVVNAFGGRYLEPAPGRTVMVGAAVAWRRAATD